jgi:hypothetical protein
MIPKIIYYSWVNPNPLPERFQKYINGWRELMPDYEIRQISLDNIFRNRFAEEAIKRDILVSVAIYNACQRMFTTGGLYFDIDIEAIQRFDDLLNDKLFLGIENLNRINFAVMGSVPFHPFMKDCLDYLDNFDFDNPGKFGIEIESSVEVATKISIKYGWDKTDKTNYLENMTIYNSKYFYPYMPGEVFTPSCIRKETHAIHHWAGTWVKL